jgi:SpoVK/Ycf46/Vps4 family AAA+-type ATPase
VLWVDELERSLAGSSSSGATDSGVTARVVSTLLTWRQETKYPVMMVCTANEIESIPPAIYRKGRMDEIWATDLPTEIERVEIFRIHIVKRDRDPEKFNLIVLAKNTENFVGSEVESCIEDGMFYAFDEGVEVATRHIMTAIKDTIPQAKRDSKDVEKIRAWVATNARYVGEKIVVPITGKANRISVLTKN